MPTDVVTALITGCARAVTDGITRGFGSEVLEEFQERAVSGSSG
jgi:hypothetical protein